MAKNLGSKTQIPSLKVILFWSVFCIDLSHSLTSFIILFSQKGSQFSQNREGHSTKLGLLTENDSSKLSAAFG